MKHPVYLRPNQVVLKAEGQPSNITESDVSNGGVLGIMAETTIYRKRDTDARDIETINKNLADSREAHAGMDKTPTTAEKI